MGTFFLDDIKQFNLKYLMLAQNMIREDVETAMFRLGMSREIADLLISITPEQVIKIASQDKVLCQFGIEEKMIIDLLIQDSRAQNEVFSHVKILMSQKLSNDSTV